MNLDVPDLPKLVRRPDGNWDVVLDDSKPKEVTKLAGETFLGGTDWAFVSESRARGAALDWWLESMRRAACHEFKPTVEKPVEEPEHWSIADRRAGYKHHD